MAEVKKKECVPMSDRESSKSYSVELSCLCLKIQLVTMEIVKVTIKSFICPSNAHTNYFKVVKLLKDRLCGLVVRVSGYRYRGLGFDSRRYQIF